MPQKQILVSRRTAHFGSGELKATFGLVRPLEVEEGLTLYFISRSEGTFTDVVAKVRDEAPVGQDAVLDIQISKDDGETWDSIFPAGDANKLVIPDGSTALVTRTTFDPDHNVIAKDDLLRIDCLQAGTTVPGKGIEVVLRWA
ncbi:MAG: hypothetical protein ACK5AZ_25595 [Bryobacteraceae bacterium]